MCSFKIILLAFCLFYWNQVKKKKNTRESYIYTLPSVFRAKGRVPCHPAGFPLFFPQRHARNI